MAFLLQLYIHMQDAFSLLTPFLEHLLAVRWTGAVYLLQITMQCAFPPAEVVYAHVNLQHNALLKCKTLQLHHSKISGVYWQTWKMLLFEVNILSNKDLPMHNNS
jgi:hypothetical protein